MKPPEPRERPMTPAEVIDYLQIGSFSALYRLIADHRLPFGRVGRRYRFRRDHIDAWMEVRGIESLRLVQRAG
jgi:excisionase family DNA binding protein